MPSERIERDTIRGVQVRAGAVYMGRRLRQNDTNISEIYMDVQYIYRKSDIYILTSRYLYSTSGYLYPTSGYLYPTSGVTVYFNPPFILSPRLKKEFILSPPRLFHPLSSAIILIFPPTADYTLPDACSSLARLVCSLRFSKSLVI